MTLVTSKGSQTGHGIRELDRSVSCGGLVVGNRSPLGLRDASESPCCLPNQCPRFGSPLRTRCLVTQEGQRHLSCGERDKEGNDGDVNNDSNFLSALCEELDLPS